MKLKTCPFCGCADPQLVSFRLGDSRNTLHEVQCWPHRNGCGARGPEMPTKTDAASSWNERSESLALDELPVREKRGRRAGR